MLINIIDAEGTVTVTMMVMPDEWETGGTSPATTTTSPADEAFETFEKLSDIAGIISEMTISLDYVASQTESQKIDYTFLGGTDIGGREAEHLKICYNDAIIELWVDDETVEILKVSADDMEIPGGQWQEGALFVEYLGLFFDGRNWDQSIYDAAKKIYPETWARANLMWSNMNMKWKPVGKRWSSSTRSLNWTDGIS